MNIDQEILAARILVVDDQLGNVQLLERLLDGAGYTQVSSTMDPTEVCALHRRHAYDLILLDVQMPVLDGFGVLGALRTGLGLHYLPVIVLTAQPGHKLRALEAGVRDFISKPFDLVEVKTRIRNMLEVRVLYRRLEAHNEVLERTVRERTAELRASEARFRGLTELASDWYWEQDALGTFTTLSGPVFEMLGMPFATPGPHDAAGTAQPAAESGWDQTERAALLERIEARQPFIDFRFHRVHSDGSRRHYRVSGQPLFDESCRFLGYRGIGVEVSAGG